MRKRIAKVDPLEDSAKTATELCAQIGFDRKSIYAWQARGAPSGPPYNIVSFYRWAASQEWTDKNILKLPSDPRLAALCISESATWENSDTAIDDELDDSGRVILPGECAYDKYVAKRPSTYAEFHQREKVIGEAVENERKKTDNQKNRGDLVTKAEAEQATGLVFESFDREGSQLPHRTVERLDGFTLDQKEKVLKAVEFAWLALLDQVGGKPHVSSGRKR